MKKILLLIVLILVSKQVRAAEGQYYFQGGVNTVNIDMSLPGIGSPSVTYLNTDYKGVKDKQYNVSVGFEPLQGYVINAEYGFPVENVFERTFNYYYTDNTTNLSYNRKQSVNTKAKVSYFKVSVMKQFNVIKDLSLFIAPGIMFDYINCNSNSVESEGGTSLSSNSNSNSSSSANLNIALGFHYILGDNIFFAFTSNVVSADNTGDVFISNYTSQSTTPGTASSTNTDYGKVRDNYTSSMNFTVGIKF
jgi:hypothetical protein